MSLTVQFTDISTPGPSGPITAWSWDFGDGNTSTSENPSHTYAAAGTYNVTLIVTGTGTDGTNSHTTSITITGSTLNSQFTYSVSSLAVSFTDSSTPGSSGPITAWHWDFGDGNTSSSQNPSHTYASAGSYNVTLTVTGTSPDGTDSYSHLIPVSSSGTTFVSVSSLSRPSFTPTRTVNFSTQSQLQTALSNAQPGDLIKYNGTGVLNISSSTNGIHITNLNPVGSPIVIDFGCSHNIWDPSKITTNYVRFTTTGRNYSVAFVDKCSNVRIYGGDCTGIAAGSGIRIMGPTNNVLWWDAYIHNIGGSGIEGQGITSGGATSYVTNCSVRAEVTRFALDPSMDPHADKGTGIHGCILHGSTGRLDNNTWIIYAHDPLQPNESSVGKTWPEGAGGSAIEIGQTPSGAGNSNNNNTYYILGERLKMICTGLNPGSNGAKQTGGNVINWWGNVPLNNNVVEWAEGNDITGQVSHGSGGGWSTVTSSIRVNHGRSSNTNQAYPNNGLSSATDPYVRGKGIIYSDCT